MQQQLAYLKVFCENANRILDHENQGIKRDLRFSLDRLTNVKEGYSRLNYNEMKKIIEEHFYSLLILEKIAYKNLSHIHKLLLRLEDRFLLWQPFLQSTPTTTSVSVGEPTMTSTALDTDDTTMSMKSSLDKMEELFLAFEPETFLEQNSLLEKLAKMSLSPHLDSNQDHKIGEVVSKMASLYLDPSSTSSQCTKQNQVPLDGESGSDKL